MDALFLRLLKLFDELGLWNDGVELIGSWSFLLYQRHLGVGALPLRTQDVDFLLPLPYPSRSTVGLSAALSELGFRSANNPDGSTFFIHPELKLEFLSPERGKGGLDARAIKPCSRFWNLASSRPALEPCRPTGKSSPQRASRWPGIPSPLNARLSNAIALHHKADFF